MGHIGNSNVISESGQDASKLVSMDSGQDKR